MTVRPTASGEWACLVAEGNSFAGEIALGNGTQWNFVMHLQNGRLSLKLGPAHRWGKAHVWAGWAMVTAVERAYKIPLVDAANVCDLINRQLGNNILPCGIYEPPFCTRPAAPEART